MLPVRFHSNLNDIWFRATCSILREEDKLCVIQREDGMHDGLLEDGGEQEACYTRVSISSP